MRNSSALLPENQSISPLPHSLYPPILSVLATGVLSSVTTLTLILFLLYRIVIWQRAHNFKHNRFILLILNLLVSNFVQSVWTVGNLVWFVNDGVDVNSRWCWAQGWLIAIGDVANGFACAWIAGVSVARVVWGWSCSTRWFYLSWALMWAVVIGLAVVPVAVVGEGVYGRLGGWCWIPPQYDELRFWTHYVWAFVFDFGIISLYLVAYVLVRRKASRRSISAFEEHRSHRILKVTIPYPFIFTLCNLPLVTSKLYAATHHIHSSPNTMAVVAALITSNGWINVIVYVYSQRQTFFTSSPPTDICQFNTFAIPFWGSATSRFGTRTTIIASATSRRRCRTSKKLRLSFPPYPHPSSPSTSSNLTKEGREYGIPHVVKTETSVKISHEPAQPADIQEIRTFMHDPILLSMPSSAMMSQRDWRKSVAPGKDVDEEDEDDDEVAGEDEEEEGGWASSDAKSAGVGSSAGGSGSGGSRRSASRVPRKKGRKKKTCM